MYPLSNSDHPATHSFRVVQLGPLTFVYYQDDETGLACTHCLELDIGGQGETREEAEQDLQEAIEVYLTYHLDQGMKEIETCKLGSLPKELTNLSDRARFSATFVAVESTPDCPERKEFHVAPIPQYFNPASLVC